MSAVVAPAEIDGCAGINCGIGASCTDKISPETGYTCGCGPGTSLQNGVCAGKPTVSDNAVRYDSKNLNNVVNNTIILHGGALRGTLGWRTLVALASERKRSYPLHIAKEGGKTLFSAACTS